MAVNRGDLFIRVTISSIISYPPKYKSFKLSWEVDSVGRTTSETSYLGRYGRAVVNDVILIPYTRSNSCNIVIWLMAATSPSSKYTELGRNSFTIGLQDSGFKWDCPGSPPVCGYFSSLRLEVISSSTIDRGGSTPKKWSPSEVLMKRLIEWLEESDIEKAVQSGINTPENDEEAFRSVIDAVQIQNKDKKKRRTEATPVPSSRAKREDHENALGRTVFEYFDVSQVDMNYISPSPHPHPHHNPLGVFDGRFDFSPIVPIRPSTSSFRSSSLVPVSGRRKALVVGFNYDGSQASLGF
eukprot:GHVH01002571.1.p2 GENE.GHVH01002571.1~~GHVH01002571.1.p2  ORF type:complete len:297 (+),score=30.55 GHVH01002571.1:1171-2061(+)